MIATNHTNNAVITTTGAYYPPDIKVPQKKTSFNEYKQKLKDSSRIALTLKLHKQGKITLDEALELIATDAQFHKEELRQEITYYPSYQNPSYATNVPYVIPGPTSVTTIV